VPSFLKSDLVITAKTYPTTQRAVHQDAKHAAPTATAMSWNENSAQPSAQLAIPGLPTEVVVFHVLKSENFRDPGHLAQLRVVSHAVAATGHPVNDLTEEQYVELGCVNALQRLQRGGTLSKEELLCEVAARCGQLEELQQLPVGRGDVLTGGGVRAPRGAAVGTNERLPVGGDDVLGGGEGRHLEVLQ
jgi:hypothetical protein